MNVKIKRIFACTLAIYLFVVSVPLVSTDSTDVIKVACVGDSITQGLGNTPYPTRLGELLGKGYEVKNFGLWGTTACVNTGRPYTTCDDSCYQSSLDYEPDIVIIMLGTNDGSDGSIAHSEEHFVEDFTTLVNAYINLTSAPEVYIVTSPHAYLGGNKSVNTRIAQMQRDVATALSLPIVDMNNLTENIPEYFPDQLHCNDTGYFIIALHIYEQVFGYSVRNITVNTQPGADIRINAWETEADSKGEARLRMAEGKHLMTVTAKGYDAAYEEIDITSDCIIDCALPTANNLALHGTLSSALGTGDMTPAVDGDLNTAWQSETKITNSDITLTFDKARTVSVVNLYWESGTRPANDGTGYTFEINEGDGWKQAPNIQIEYGEDYTITRDTITFDMTAVTAMRVNVKKVTNDKYAPKLYEFAVFGAGGNGAIITMTNIETIADDTQRETQHEKTSNSINLPDWALPVGITVVAVVILACILWVFSTFRRED